MIKLSRSLFLCFLPFLLLHACTNRYEEKAVNIIVEGGHVGTEIILINDQLCYVSAKDSQVKVQLDDHVVSVVPLSGDARTMVADASTLFYVVRGSNTDDYESLEAIDIETGEIRWRQTTHPFSTIYGGMAMVVTDSSVVSFHEDSLYSFSKNSGDLLHSVSIADVDLKQFPALEHWKSDSYQHVINSFLKSHDQLLYMSDPDSVFIERNRISGSANDGWSILLDKPYEVVAVGGDGAIAISQYPEQANIVSIYDAGTGQLLFQEDIGKGKIQTLEGDLMAVSTFGEGITVYNFRTGELLYTTEDKSIYGATLNNNQLIYLTTNGSLKVVRVADSND